MVAQLPLYYSNHFIDDGHCFDYYIYMTTTGAVTTAASVSIGSDGGSWSGICGAITASQSLEVKYDNWLVGCCNQLKVKSLDKFNELNGKQTTTQGHYLRLL